MATRCFEGIQLYDDLDGRQWGLRSIGNRYIHWIRDTSGNPIIRDPETGILYYADWNPETHQFDKKEALSIASRKAFLKQKYFPPSGSEQAKIVRQEMSKEDITSQLQESRKRCQQYLDSHKVRLPVASHQVSATIQLPRAPVPAPTDSYTGESESSTIIKRPILLIYVRFAGVGGSGASTGSSVSDSYILNNLMGDKSTFKTIVNYYQQQFKGKVDISVINNKVYHVTLPMKAYRYGGDTNYPDTVDFNRDVLYAALKDVFNTQGVGSQILAGITNQITETDASCVWTAELTDGTEVILKGAAYQIDPSICTPVVLIHGQEAAAGAGSGTAWEANVWGHAFAEHYTAGFDWDGEFKSWAYDYDYMGYDPSKDITFLDETNIIKPPLQYRISSIATFGSFMGTDNTNMGVMTHELAHALFYLPDLYDVYRPGEADRFHVDDSGASTTIPDTEDDITGLGEWSLMAYNWTYTSSTETPGSCPPNLDGYSLWYFQQKWGTPKPCITVAESGDQNISDPFTPHVVPCADNSDELFILQVRCFKGYDAAIPFTWKDQFHSYSETNYRLDPTPDAVQPGILIEHVNAVRKLDDGGQWGITYKQDSSDPDFKYMLAVVAEAHGGDQHLLIDTSKAENRGKYNYGDRRDLFGTLTQDSFGETTDPNNAYWFQEGFGSFAITNIKADADTCTASYHIEFTQEPELPEEPEPPKEPEPAQLDCYGRPRCWRFRVLRYSVPVGFVQHW